VVMHRIANPL